MKTITREELTKIIEEHYADPNAVSHQISQWLAHGRSIAVYQNMALDSSTVGLPKILTCNHPDAQFEGDPPEQCPDFPGEVNWRYRLRGVLAS